MQKTATKIPTGTISKTESSESVVDLLGQIEELVFKNNEYADDIMLRSSLNYIKAKFSLKNCDETVLNRFEEIREGALAIANLSFTKQIPVTGEDDIFNYIATLLNHLSNALQLKLYDDEKLETEDSSEETGLKNRSIELLNFYKFHAYYTASSNDPFIKGSFDLLEDFVSQQNIRLFCIKGNINLSAAIACIESALFLLSSNKIKKSYQKWSQENLPIRVMTAKQFNLLESEIKYDAITKMALNYDVYKQLDFMQIQTNLRKKVSGLCFKGKLTSKLKDAGVIKIADLMNYDWQELIQKAHLNKSEQLELRCKLDELNCLTLLEKGNYTMHRSNGKIVGLAI